MSLSLPRSRRLLWLAAFGFASACVLLLAIVNAVYAVPIGGVSIDATASATPADGSVTINVALAGPLAGTVTAQYTTVDGTATAPADYTAQSGTVIFAPGVPDQQITIAITNPGTGAPNKSFTVVLSNVSSPGWLVNSTCTVTIVETPPATVSFKKSNVTVDERDRRAKLVVTLDGTPGGPVSIDYATADGTAVAGTDYDAASGTIKFPKGVKSKTIHIGIIDNDSYSDQTVSFTVTLSNPSSNAVVASPTVATVAILDDDKPPIAKIGISGVGDGQRKKPGGYVMVNANNDNGSKLCYVDEKGKPDPKRPAKTWGIPIVRDFDPKNVNLSAPDPDLLKILLSTENLKAGGPETIVLSATINGRAKIQIWDTATKNNKIATPATWSFAGLPSSVFVEGMLEGAAEREVTLQLQILNGGAPVSTDTCALSVVPILLDHQVLALAGKAPGILRDPDLGWELDSAANTDGEQAFKMYEQALWEQCVRGQLRFIQTVNMVNNLPGGWGADLGPKKWDFAPPNNGKPLVDCAEETMPFYSLNPKGKDRGFGLTFGTDTDSPALPLGAIKKLRGASVLPKFKKTTTVDVTFNYVNHAAVAFGDGSIYCLGLQPWSVRFSGKVAYPRIPDYQFTGDGNNADTGSGPFAAGVRNNANPTAIGPTTANDGRSAWR